MVHHQTNRLHVRILVINTVLDTVRPIPWGPLCRHGGIPLTSAGFTRDQHGCRPLSLLRGVLAQGLARLRWERSTDVATPRGRQVIQTYVGTRSVIRCVLDREDCVHVADQGSIVLWWNTRPLSPANTSCGGSWAVSSSLVARMKQLCWSMRACRVRSEEAKAPSIW